MVAVTVKVKFQTNLSPTFVVFLIVVLFPVMFLSSSALTPSNETLCPSTDPVPKRIGFSFGDFGTGSVDGSSVSMEGVRGQHDHHKK